MHTGTRSTLFTTGWRAMRGFVVRRPVALRVGFFASAVALGIACSDAVLPTAPEAVAPSVGLSSEGGGEEVASGPSIATDKPDYAPGETVIITGSGFAPGETVSLLLVEDPEVHGPREWTVAADAEGGFTDDSFSPEVHHIGVVFTLTATGQTSGLTASTTFEDGNIRVRPDPTSLSIDVFWRKFNGNSSCTGSPNETGTVTSITGSDHTVIKGTDAGQSLELTAPAVLGYSFVSWTSGATTIATAVACIPGSSGNQNWEANYSVAVATPTKLAFTNTPFTGVVGECLGPYAVQSQTAGGDAANVSSNTTVGLSTDGTGTFYSNNDCSTSITSVTINSGSSSSSNFYYKATARGTGTHELTADDTSPDELTSATQDQTINKADTETTIDNVSPSPAEFDEEVTVQFSVAAQSPGSGTPSGTVNVTNAANTVTYCSASVATGECSFDAPSPAVLGLVARYQGDDDFNASYSSTTNLTVNKADTDVEVTADKTSPQPFGTEIVFTAHVTYAGGDVTSGSVSFRRGGTDCSTGTEVQAAMTLNSEGKRTWTTSTLAAGNHTIRACYGGTSDFENSNGTMPFTIGKATTGLTYTGDQIVLVPNTVTLRGLLTSDVASCVSGKNLIFRVRPHPATPLDENSVLQANATTNSSGVASTTVSSSGWQEGVYDVRVGFVNDPNCANAKDDATMMVLQPGSAATGGGFLAGGEIGGGRANFAFNVRQVENSNPIAYKGQFLMIRTFEGSPVWRCKGILNNYGTSSSVNVASGVCDLQSWDPNEGPEGDWVLADNGAARPFLIYFVDNGSGSKGKNAPPPDEFGFEINYTLFNGFLDPSFDQTAIKGGNIDVKDSGGSTTSTGGSEEPSSPTKGGGKKK